MRSEVRAAARAKRLAKQGVLEVLLPSTLTRQQLRQVGRAEARKVVKDKFNLARRSIRRAAAIVLHDDAWQKRDKQAIARLTRG
jgi:predicted glycosyltransferase